MCMFNTHKHTRTLMYIHAQTHTHTHTRNILSVKVYLHLGLVPHFKYFDGIIFQYVGTKVTKARSRKRTIILAAGGRYDELVG